MGDWVDGEWVWMLKWRRNLFEWELGLVDQLMLQIGSVALSAGVKDKWVWKATSDGIYSVKSAYSKIIEGFPADRDGSGLGMNKKVLHKLWKSHAPYKSLTMAWRALKDRLATGDNLIKRGVSLSIDDKACVWCKIESETCNHLFILCPKIMEVWNWFLRWIGIQPTSLGNLVDHFFSFISLGNQKKAKKLFSGIWLCALWTIWKWRNECKFENSCWDPEKLLGGN